jgi:hypothetical protein
MTEDLIVRPSMRLPAMAADTLAPEAVAVLDMGASAVRLVIAEVAAGRSNPSRGGSLARRVIGSRHVFRRS